MGSVFFEDPFLGIAVHRLLTLASRTDVVLKTANRIAQHSEHQNPLGVQVDPACLGR